MNLIFLNLFFRKIKSNLSFVVFTKNVLKNKIINRRQLAILKKPLDKMQSQVEVREN